MRLILTIALTALMLSFTKGSSAQMIDSTTLNSSSITGNIVLVKTTKYLMKGFNYVQNGGSITIPAGTIIMGEFNSKGTLIIQRGGRIFANGTPDAPVVFTSQRSAGQRAAGDWGGVIILGRSAINTSTGADSAEIEGFGPGLGPIYGGQPVVNDDNSGVLRFVRIEFPGVNLTGISGNEINGLTMGGVGSGTTIDYVQVSYSGDDSFEWFGGNVNCNHLISYKALDDDWDCDNGFRGRVQYGLSVRDKDIADISSSNGFEIDNNNNTPSNTNGPRTKPFFSNMTVIGPFETTSTVVNPLFQRGGHLRRNMQACIYNSLIMGWRVGIRFDGSGVITDANNGIVQLRTNIFSGNLTLADQTGGSISPDPAGFISATNTVYTDNSSVLLTSPFAIYPNVPLPGNNVNNWMPLNGSPALAGADFTNPNLAGFQNVGFRGAFGTNNWTYNWSQFNPINYLIPTPSNYTITVFPEGFYNTNSGQLYNGDTVRVYLRNASSPYSIIDSASAYVDKITFTGKFVFKYAPSGTYYLQTKHRNSIETWSKSGGEPFTMGAENFYNFTSSASQAFGSNQKSVAPGKFGIYSGDDNQDGVVDIDDLILCYNDILAFTTGYAKTDNNNDDIVDLSDLVIVNSNGTLFTAVIRP